MLDVNVCVGVCLYYCCCCNRILDAAGLLTRPSLRSVLGLVEQVRTNQSIYTRSQFFKQQFCPDTPRTAEDAEYDECVGRTGSAGDRGSLPAFGALGTCRGAARVGSDERDCVTCAVAVALTVCIFCHRNGAASAHGLAESVHCSTIVLCHNPIWSDA